MSFAVPCPRSADSEHLPHLHAPHLCREAVKGGALGMRSVLRVTVQATHEPEALVRAPRRPPDRHLSEALDPFAGCPGVEEALLAPAPGTRGSGKAGLARGWGHRLATTEGEIERGGPFEFERAPFKFERALLSILGGVVHPEAGRLFPRKWVIRNSLAKLGKAVVSQIRFQPAGKLADWYLTRK